MARNRSEKLPSCPEAISYADAVEQWLLSDRNFDDLGWGLIPVMVRRQITAASKRGSGHTFVPSLSYEGFPTPAALATGRCERMNYIREAYAT